MNNKPKYIKFSRSFEKGGIAPWLVFYMRSDLKYVSEIIAICDKCKKKETVEIFENMNHVEVFKNYESKHKNCGLN